MTQETKQQRIAKVIGDEGRKIGLIEGHQPGDDDACLEIAQAIEASNEEAGLGYYDKETHVAVPREELEGIERICQEWMDGKCNASADGEFHRIRNRIKTMIAAAIRGRK